MATQAAASSAFLTLTDPPFAASIPGSVVARGGILRSPAEPPAVTASADILSENDLQFLWLPMAHSFGKVLLSTQLAIGFATAIDGRVPRIVDNLAIVRPTFMGAAPRIVEKAYGRIVGMTEAEGGVKLKISQRSNEWERPVSPVLGLHRAQAEHEDERLIAAGLRAAALD